MADESNNSKKLTLGVFSHAMQTLATSIRNLLFDAAGKIKAALIPVGAGLKVTGDGKLAFDAENVQIDASKVNIADASKTVKGLVRVGDGLNVEGGVISVIAQETASDADVDAAVSAAFDAVFNAPAA